MDVLLCTKRQRLMLGRRLVYRRGERRGGEAGGMTGCLSLRRCGTGWGQAWCPGEVLSPLNSLCASLKERVVSCLKEAQVWFAGSSAALLALPALSVCLCHAVLGFLGTFPPLAV